MSQIAIIVAVSKNGVIGKDNQLIWRLSDDLKNFKRLTTGHVVVMGRKTFDSIGKPLPNRINVVISRQKDLQIEGCLIANSLENAFGIARKNAKHDEEIFVIGGEDIYRQALPFSDRVYCTEVEAVVEGDAHFAPLDMKVWFELLRDNFSANEKNEYNFSFAIYERKSL